MTEDYRKKTKELELLSSGHKILQGMIIVVCGSHIALSIFNKIHYDRSIVIVCFGVFMIFILKFIMNKYLKETKYKLEEERWKEEINKVK